MVKRSARQFAEGAVLAASMVAPCAFGSPTTLSYSGNLNDPGNAALVWADLTAAQFLPNGDPGDNVALYTLTLPSLSLVTFTSASLSGGGILAYLSLFDAAGAFIDSTYTDTVLNGVDFNLTDTLAAGTYQLALSANQNFSVAENGGGTLADGFLGSGIPFGDSGVLGDYSYSFTAAYSASSAASGASGGSTVPEPSTLWLVLLASTLAGATGRSWRARD